MINKEERRNKEMKNKAKMDIEQRTDSLILKYKSPDYKRKNIWKPNGEEFNIKIEEIFKDEETYLNHIKGE